MTKKPIALIKASLSINFHSSQLLLLNLSRVVKSSQELSLSDSLFHTIINISQRKNSQTTSKT